MHKMHRYVFQVEQKDLYWVMNEIPMCLQKIHVYVSDEVNEASKS